MVRISIPSTCFVHNRSSPILGGQDVSVGNLSKTTLSGLQDQAAVQSGSNKSSQQDALSAGPHRTTNEGQGAPLPGATSVECHVTLHNVATRQGDAAGSAKLAKGSAPTGPSIPKC